MSDAQQDQAIQHILDALDGYGDSEKVKVNTYDVADYLNAKLVAGSNITITESDSGGVYTLTISSPDSAVISNGSFNDGYNVKISSSDGVPEFLEDKVIAGDNITITKSDEGGREILTISTPDCCGCLSSLSDGYYKAKVSDTDTVAKYLEEKIVAGSNIQITKSDVGGVEILTISASDAAITSAGSDGYNVKISSDDTEAGFLQDKLIAGDNLTITKSDVGGVETLTISGPDLADLDELNDKIDAVDTRVDYTDEAIYHLRVAADGYQDAIDLINAGVGVTTGGVIAGLPGSDKYYDLGNDGYRWKSAHVFGEEGITIHYDKPNSFTTSSTNIGNIGNIGSMNFAAAHPDIEHIIIFSRQQIVYKYDINTETLSALLNDAFLYSTIGGNYGDASTYSHHTSDIIKSACMDSQGYVYFIVGNDGIGSWGSDALYRVDPDLTTATKLADLPGLTIPTNQVDLRNCIGWRQVRVCENYIGISKYTLYSMSTSYDMASGDLLGVGERIYELDPVTRSLGSIVYDELDTFGSGFTSQGAQTPFDFNADGDAFFRVEPGTGNLVKVSLPSLNDQVIYQSENAATYPFPSPISGVLGCRPYECIVSDGTTTAYALGNGDIQENSYLVDMEYENKSFFAVRGPLGDTEDNGINTTVVWVSDNNAICYTRVVQPNPEPRKWVLKAEDSTGRLRLFNDYHNESINSINVSEEDGYFGVGVAVPNEKVTVGGAISFVEQGHVFESSDGYGKLYVSDGDLYYLDDLGVLVNISDHEDNLDDLSVFVSQVKEACDGYKDHLESNDTAIGYLRTAADGYQTDISELDTAVSHILVASDGYQLNIEANGTAIGHLIVAADGYGLYLDANATAIGHLRVAADGYQTHLDNNDVAIKHLRDAADGYQTDISELDVAVSHILVAADGYGLYLDANATAIGHLRVAADGYQSQIDDVNGEVDTLEFDFAQAIKHLRDAADGYQPQIDDVNGEVDTLEADFAQAVRHLRVAADGYGLYLDANATAIGHLRVAADGYQTDISELDVAVSHLLVAADGYGLYLDANATAIGHLRVAADGYQVQLDTHDGIITNIQNALADGYADVAQGADGYIAFFTGDTSIAGDNDLSYNRATGKVTVNGDLETTKHLKSETLQVTDGANYGHVLTADDYGNATWQEPAAGGNADFDKILTHSDGTIVVHYSTGNVVTLS